MSKCSKMEDFVSSYAEAYVHSVAAKPICYIDSFDFNPYD